VKIMRPRYLEIEGLQSFKEQQKIDFDKLSETGIFGIFGPTGSGKSTILDAITLALYGTVNRAAKGTQGIINTDLVSLRVSFTFDLAKEGSRKTYRVERQYRRRKDSDSSAEAKLARLLEIGGEQEHILADKHSDVNHHVIQLVGLKFEDFIRSVVLPQNKFQEFLLSPRGEKTKMLERIFYLEEYGRQLADKVNRQMGAVRNRLSNIEGALSTLGDASPEALIEAERKVAEAQALRAAAANQQKTMEEKYAKGLDLYRLSREQEELVQRLEGYAAQQHHIHTLQEHCLKSEAANSIKPILESYKAAGKGSQEAQRSLQLLAERLRELTEKREAAQGRHDEFLQQKDRRLPELIAYKTKLQECQNLQQEMQEQEGQLQKARKEYGDIHQQMETTRGLIAEKARQKEAQGEEINALEQRAEGMQIDGERRSRVTGGAALEKELQGLTQALENQKQKCRGLQQNLEDYRQAHRAAEEAMREGKKALAGMNADKEALEAARPANREEIESRRSALLLLESRLQSMMTIQKAKEDAERRQESCTGQQAALRTEARRAEESLQRLLTERDSFLELLKELRAQQEHHAALQLAKGLKEGMPCPVCGAAEHPSPAAAEDHESGGALEARQKELQTALEAQQEPIRELEHSLVRMKQQRNSLQEQQEQLSSELQGREKELEGLRQTLPEPLQAEACHGLEGYIKEETKRLEAAAEEYSLWEKKLQQQKEAIKAGELEWSELMVKEGRLAAFLSHTHGALKQEYKQLKAQEEAFEQARDQYKELQKQLKIENFAQELEAVAQRDEEGVQLTRSIREKRVTHNELIEELQKLLEKTNEISQFLNEKRAEGIRLREQQDEKDRKIKAVIGEKQLPEELEKTQQEILELEAGYKNSAEELKKVSESLEELQRQRSAYQSSLAYFKERLAADEISLQRAMEEKQFGDLGAVEAAMLTAEKLRLYQEEIAKHQREKGSLEDRLRSIQKELGGQSLDRQQWQQLAEDHEQSKANLEAAISCLEAARSSYHRIKESFERWVKLQEDLKIISRKKDMLEQLQKLLKGNAFIEFISEERMRYIATEASITLGQLTKFRYVIELDTENGFVIRDNANGGVLRSVASLSGGETFLTSLSLALALSSQLQLKGQSPLEFFFLDEGFGTLDNSLLDTVMDSLERLSSSKRVIGLISHVPELKNRIARRLIVEAPDRVGTGSRISIEKA
jgi:exonuclease SbcC